MLIYICDDVEQDRMRLTHSLQKYSSTLSSEYAVSDLQIASFDSADEMIKTYAKSRVKPDLIFLDIYMQGKDGMDAARMLRKLDCQAGVIFVTNSDDHAIESYDVDALYYLKKPYTWDRFLAAMEKCRQIFLINASCFTASSNRKKYKIPYHKILYFETSGHTVIVHQKASDYLSFYLSMASVMEMIRDYPYFLPVGKSYIVNMNDVKQYNDGMLEMEDGSYISVPVRCQKDVQSQLSEFKKKENIA